jgi:hypothetical protein
MIKKYQKLIALIAVFTFISLLQVSSLPLRAEKAPAQEGIYVGNAEQGPRFIEEEGYSGYQAKKKSILPIVLIGVGVVAVAAVLFLVVLKTSYDIIGTWEMQITYLTSGYTNSSYSSTWVFTGTKESGSFVENDAGITYPGAYTVTDKKNIWFKYTNYTDVFIGKFDSKDKMSGTFSTSTYNGTWIGTKTSSSTAALRPTPQATTASTIPRPKRG